MKWKRQRPAFILSLCMIWSLLVPAGQAVAADWPQPVFGQVLDKRSMEIGPGADYTWYNMSLPQGLEKVHVLEFDPKNQALDMQPGMTDGKVYGMQGVTKMADDADKEGNRVIAAINGDFYDMTTGVPLGLFMGGGEILVSPPAPTDWYAFGLKNDGTTIYGLSPALKRTLHIGGKDIEISEINRMRENSSKLNLYTSSFHTSTMTNNLGDEVVLDIVSGEVKSGSALKLKVADIRKDKGNTPLSPGKVVLSASGTYRNALQGLKVGDEVTAQFELEEAWKDVKMAIGGVAQLLKDGDLQPQDDKALYPRVAIGTKADGSIVMIEIDGRAPGFSEGVSYDDLAKVMKDIGVVNALCLDGGGSSTFVVKLPGEPVRKLLNRPSDGGERKTANGILLVNKAPEGAASKLVVQPNMERVLVGSSYSLKSAGVDANGHPAAITGTPQWSADPALGAFDANGTFTAGQTAGEADVTVTANGLTGKGRVEVVKELTELRFPDTVKSYAPGEKAAMQVTAVRDGQEIVADNRQFAWRVEGPIGSIDEQGVFVAANESEKSGKIIVSYGGIEASMEVTVGQPPVILEDFEDGVGRYKEVSGARYKSVLVSEETGEDFVRFGSKAAKLKYDFTDTVGISGAYLEAKDPASQIEIPGYPEKISVWVYGDGKKHWLRGQLRDANNGAVDLNFTDEKEGLDFEGWKYLEADVPKGKPLPLRMTMPIRYMETKNDNKTDGEIYIDQIRALYGPATDDMDPPILKDFSPADGSTIKTATPEIHVYGEDYGYDPVTHPATTLIDPDKTRMYLDGVLVQHGFYPPKGKIHYTPSVPLADGVHTVKVKIRDLSGNQSEKEWMFIVDTGSSKLTYDGPDNVYAGKVYTVDVKSVKASNIKRADIAFTFDPLKVGNLEVAAGPKLTDANVQPEVEADKGAVRLKFIGLNSLKLTDDDVLAQIKYRVKTNADGELKVNFTSGSIAFMDKGETDFGFFGLPLVAAIQYHLRLNWNPDGVAEGQETVFGVVDEQGLPVAGARIMTADGTDIGVTDEEGKLATKELTSKVQEYELQAVLGNQYSPVVKFKVSPLAGSDEPYNISVAMADPATSRGFTWHTHANVEATVVEMAKRDGFTGFDAPNVQKVSGTSSLYHTWDIGTVRVHKAVADGLEPGTEYVYRVGDGNGKVSKQGAFKTAEANGERTEFLFFGDSQASNEDGFKLWSDIAHKAVLDHPNFDFILQAGDMVEDGFKEKEWSMWFKAAQDIFLRTTLVSVVGNHEVTGTRKNDDFLAHFNNPQNGLESLKGSNYSFEYHNAHIAVLNSEYDLDEQKEWLRRDLAATGKTWKIVTFHRGPYGSQYNSEHIRNAWTSAFDEFNVDLALNGHDHVYVRTYPLRGGKAVAEGDGTTYVVGGSSGPKFYPVTPREWQLKVDGEQTQIYGAIEIVGGELKFTVKTIGDRLVDEFTLRKGDPAVPPAEVVIDQPEMNLAVGESVKLNAAVLPDNAADKTVTWSVYSASADGMVKVTRDGVVTAHEMGTAVVRATSVVEAVYADSLITVDHLPDVKVGEVRLDRTEGKLKVGETLQLHAAVLPEKVQDKSVIWAVYGAAPAGAATVSDSGLIAAVKPGTAVIRALSKADAGKYADFNLTVESASRPPEPERPGSSSSSSSSDAGSYKPSEPAKPAEPSVKVENGKIAVQAKREQGNAVATAVITAEALDQALKDAQPDKRGVKKVRIEVAADKEATGVDVSMPAAALTGSGLQQQYVMVTPQAIVTVPSNMVSKDAAKDAKTISIVIGQSDRGSWPAALSAKLGERPAVRVELKADGKPLSGMRAEAPMMIALPYKPTAQELAQPHNLMIWLVDVGGHAIAVPSARYDAATGTVRFEAMQLGTYAVGFNNKEFADTAKLDWAKVSIEALAAKGIIDGVGENRFAPQLDITRADFTVMMVRALGLQTSGGGTAGSGADSGFADVNADAYYAEAVGMAKELGFVQGKGDNAFGPRDSVARQDMFTMAARALEITGMLQVDGDSDALAAYTDSAQVSDYAKGSLAGLLQEGLLQGSGSKLHPDSRATRAEVAVFLNRVLNRVYE
ncbi:phosphodiester glycosidase family protein [Paenibacillus apiarius]|uniref:phosphodiester glycosidase family protein n=1 Tax=Paenibacillus apiarius TaxID=46240 RepID=UPI00197DAC22|nr:phosphodiester glycosidase family protein [Paenibacillus apiarius]MBN3524261.1 phosphodiester glycosidase family protein [Paenibacillus apiarius]